MRTKPIAASVPTSVAISAATTEINKLVCRAATIFSSPKASAYHLPVQDRTGKVEYLEVLNDISTTAKIGVNRNR